LGNGSVQCCRQMQLFFFVCPSSPSVMPFSALGEASIPRVQFFPECPIFVTRGSVWHS
jgi:hypothetical protein